MTCFRAGCNRRVHKLVRLERPVEPLGLCYACGNTLGEIEGAKTQAEAGVPNRRRRDSGEWRAEEGIGQ